MTRLDSTRRVRARVEPLNFVDSKINSTFSFTFFHRANTSKEARMLIFNALVTDKSIFCPLYKSKFSPLSPVLALTRGSRVEAPTRLTKILTRITKIKTRTTPTAFREHANYLEITSPPELDTS